jgi:hypothetical protein
MPVESRQRRDTQVKAAIAMVASPFDQPYEQIYTAQTLLSAAKPREPQTGRKGW